MIKNTWLHRTAKFVRKRMWLYMRKAPQAKKITTTILLFGLLAVFIFPFSAVTKAATSTATGEPALGEQSQQFPDKHWEKAFHTQLQQWIDQLAANDSTFHSWSSATYKYEALAPGSHLWVITLYPQNKAADTSTSLGYLIVGEPSSPEQEQVDRLTFQLLEYGLGTPPFHSKKQEMSPVYGGLESYWQGKNQVIDATSDEAYPFHPAEAAFDGKGLNPEQRLTNIGHWSNPTDPFANISWLNQSSASSLSAEQLIHTDNDASVILVARLYHGAVLAPYPVTGFHLWTKLLSGDKGHSDISQSDINPSAHTQLFVAVWDQGERYLPFEHYAQLGSFLAAGGAEENQAEQE